jgi:hypothetical protein
LHFRKAETAAMADAKSRLVIRTAGMNCLAGCLESNVPFTYLRDFEEQLRKMGWDEADVKAVSMEVLPFIVRRFNSASTDTGDANMTTS